jgi:hypothetical protein
MSVKYDSFAIHTDNFANLWKTVICMFEDIYKLTAFYLVALTVDYILK